jgi:uncharacterized membrane protein
MSGEALVVVAVVGAATIVIKASGPVLVGAGGLTEPLTRVVDLLAPAVLAALVATQTLSDGENLVIDERAAGVGAAGVAVALRAPVLAVVAVGAAVTALLRAL